MKSILLCAAIAFAVSPAVAQEAPKESKGVKEEKLTTIDLGKQNLNDYTQRQMRMREITIEPGGIVAVHSHKDRPAMDYVLAGSVVDHREGQQPHAYDAGQSITEATDVVHWVENKSTQPAKLVTVDLVKQ
ncbi:MAG TPA: cupin domain-containing protein [Stellaceae bacterium]|nr:cupin domain-containing protein [Stellaceae bacterium]